MDYMESVKRRLFVLFVFNVQSRSKKAKTGGTKTERKYCTNVAYPI